MSSNSFSKMSKCLISQTSNLPNMEENTISRKRSIHNRLDDVGFFVNGNSSYSQLNIEFWASRRRSESLVLNDVFFAFNGELLSIGKVVLPNTDRSIGMSFPVVDLNSGNMCSSCKEFFKKYSRRNTISYLQKAGLRLEIDGQMTFSTPTSEKAARPYIMKYFLLIMRDLRSLEKLCFDYYIGPYSGERDKCGEGLFLTKSGYTYHGSFKGNHFNGHGSLSSLSCIHRGYFRSSTITGLGEVISYSSRFIGEMVQGYANGLGYKDDKQHDYIGQFDKGHVYGSILYLPDKTKFTFGQYKTGYSYHIETLNSIEGMFLNHVPYGICVQTNQFGSIYIGNTRQWKPHGKGMSIYPLDRMIYIGSWKDGLWEGDGKKISYEENMPHVLEGVFQQGGQNCHT